MPVSSVIVASLLAGCVGEAATKGRNKKQATDTAVSATDTDTDTQTEPDTTTTTEPDTTLPEFDCSTMPDMPGPAVNLEAPRGYNDLVFDLSGQMIGSDENVFWSATDPDNASIYATGIGRVYKMGLLPGGDVVAARSNSEGGGVIRVDANGGTTVLAPGLNGYGLAVGSDGMVYLATNYTAGAEAIIRIDPVTGDAEQIIDCSLFPARAIAFNRDFTRLYFGTLNGNGVYGVDMDANLDPIGDPVLIRNVPDSWHDTVEVDACGNIYVGSVFSSSIFRINEDLSVNEIIDWDFNTYGHGFEWGDANGGWDELSIYVTHPYIGSRIDSFYLGVPGAHWTGIVIGGFTL
jgi:hypothetical protein